ncbi:family of serine hydrolases 3 [Trichomonascus vanleenenianus]|uniref:alpha/beta hydrolase n=1 Tax=Trichomonascus vanleenenianus TaxID=2268995 RepID=UPI003ECA6455
MGGRILCLHGFVQNGPLFARKSSGVRKALSKIGYETVYLTAPVELAISDLPFDLNVGSLGGDSANGSSDMRSWWPNSESAPEHYSLDQAFEAIKESIAQDGPYDGVLGFSQGAGLAGILCQMMHKLHPDQPPLKFGVFYSGFRVKPEEHQHYYTPPISTPTLHIMGTLDTVVSEERTMWLYNSCEESKRTLLTHPGGHFVPNGRDMVDKLAGWLTSVEKEKEHKAEEDWDEFDKIGA